jgi:hypothetical protein
MPDELRKKSPRAPSVPLDEAIERAIRVYNAERRHPAPIDVIAQTLGYKSANNGSALAMIASLRAFGLLEKAGDGKLGVSKDVETYQFAPSEDAKRDLRIKWLKEPKVFADLLEKIDGALPSDASVRFSLIQQGFAPSTAEQTLNVLKKSVEFAGLFAQSRQPKSETVDSQVESAAHLEGRESAKNLEVQEQRRVSEDHDRIPVRLEGGRRAWLEIPIPFYEADKKRLIAQIELVLTDENNN